MSIRVEIAQRRKRRAHQKNLLPASILDGAALLTTTTNNKRAHFFVPPRSIHRCRPPSPSTNSRINNSMPATTLFDRADFDSVIRTTTSSVMDATPVKKTNDAASAPSRDVSPSTSSESVGSSDEDDIASLTGVIGTLRLSSSSRLNNTIAPSEHKVAENEGRHAVEPLLKDNPNRFVLFPIQDNDVSF